MELKNLIGSALTVRGKSGRFNRAASHRGIRFAPLLLVAVMLAAVAVLAETSNPARTAQAQDYGNVVCQSPPAVSCTYDDVSGERTVWSATMTVGEPYTEPVKQDIYRIRLTADTSPGRQHWHDRFSHTVATTTLALHINVIIA